jgi:uncharacterized membrane protein YphA (DoxX/SURF4 family)
MSKSRKIIGWTLTILVSALLLFSVSGKLFNPEMQAGMAAWGLEDYIIIIAIGELLAALLFLLPSTNLIGAFLLSSHMGGAIVVHMSHDESFLMQSVVLVVVWIIAFIRNPKLIEIVKGN